MTNLNYFEDLKVKYPPGHTKDSSSYPISQAIYSLVRLLQPSHVVEVGTFEGATSVWLARAIEENNRGTFTGYEINAERAKTARANLEAAVGGRHWQVKTMDIQQEPYVETDFVFLDCDKKLYSAALSKCLIPVNGYVVAHDTVSWPDAVQFYKLMGIQPDWEVVNLHTEQGLMIARKKS
jgi:predicted O-methyltransferase YrrM